ncbi:MAG: hypothetical protein C3F11_13765 [Methylocystaceae bacterium]|nr:MAG: hypothetical protein C3F11_13765 [Methylocystaceae bacterium]
MIAERFSAGFAALALIAAATGASAQSFDCAEATTSTERLLCADQQLGALDATLADEVKKALAAAPAKRDELLADERKWVKERDRTCAIPAGALAGEARARAIDCLAVSYRERVAAVRSLAGKDGDGGTGAADLCRRLGDRYRILLERGPQAPFKKSFYADSPLDTLAAERVGVTIAAPAVEITEYSRGKLVAWAKGQKPSFALPEDVSKELDEIAHSRLRIDRLPGTDYFAASVVEGTAACYSAVYFDVARGRARLADGPRGWEDDGAGLCGVTRSFGKIDETPVAFEEQHDYTPSLASRSSVTQWTGRGFGSTCVVTFEFSPRFDPHGTYNEWDENCEGADCDALRRAALALVEAAQKNPLEAEKAAVARLTDAQRIEFAEMKKQAGALNDKDAAEAADPASYVDNAPLLLPLVHDGRIYLAGVGHFTIGWRIFSDWSATLRRLDNGKIADRAVFAIGMTKGRLEKVSVK